MGITIRSGADNEIMRSANQIRSTDDIGDEIFEFLGVDRSRSEFVVRGAPYEGPLYDGDVVEIRTRANSKGC